MTPLPKRRISRRRQGKRRAAIKLTVAGLVVCNNCNMLRKPHQMCANCGYYNGKEICKIEDKSKKKKNENS